jgi:hypothetical protein
MHDADNTHPHQPTALNKRERVLARLFFWEVWRAGLYA